MHVVRDGQEKQIDTFPARESFHDDGLFPLPYLLLLDLKMPRRTAFEMFWTGCMNIRSSIGFAGGHVLSSSAHQIDIERAYELGAGRVFGKPASLEKRVELQN